MLYEVITGPEYGREDLGVVHLGLEDGTCLPILGCEGETLAPQWFGVAELERTDVEVAGIDRRHVARRRIVQVEDDAPDVVFGGKVVITSYSIHYTKLYDYLFMGLLCSIFTAAVNEYTGPRFAYRAHQLLESRKDASDDA